MRANAERILTAPGQQAAESATCAEEPAAPDWSGVSEEILCPLCEYNLRGLAEPRCPECGYRFEWPNLLDPSRRLHPYLFEHHPDRPVWSFVRTLAGGLRPGRFWRSLQPSQPVSVRRLSAYAALLLVACLLMGCAFVAETGYGMWRRHTQERAWEDRSLRRPQMAPYRAEVIKKWGSLDAYLDRDGLTTPWKLLLRADARQKFRADFALPVAIIFWLSGTWLALSVFEISRRRAGIRRIHFLRCVTYAGDVVWWLALVLPLIRGALLAAEVVYGTGFQPGMLPIAMQLERLIRWVCIAGLLIFVIRLMAAYRHYLRFPHAVAVVLSSQAISLLIVLNVMLLLSRL
ncbi:MAG: hypothetical protein DCC65_09005 [Planctomycetota bacterium]|nr:MAG: hypothetical protein DCC65_09005 [Planctomycetota bacterium]